jgi:hypothetical protein
VLTPLYYEVNYQNSPAVVVIPISEEMSYPLEITRVGTRCKRIEWWNDLLQQLFCLIQSVGPIFCGTVVILRDRFGRYRPQKRKEPELADFRGSAHAALTKGS